jgi:hypothetical protein
MTTNLSKVLNFLFQRNGIKQNCHRAKWFGVMTMNHRTLARALVCLHDTDSSTSGENDAFYLIL